MSKQGLHETQGVIGELMSVALLNEDTSKVLYYLHRKSANTDANSIDVARISKATGLPFKKTEKALKYLQRDVFLVYQTVDPKLRKPDEYALTDKGTILTRFSYDALLSPAGPLYKRLRNQFDKIDRLIQKI